MSINILHPHQDRMGNSAGLMRNTSAVRIGKNHRSVAELNLGPVILTDFYALDGPKCVGKPDDGCPYVSVRQYWDDGCVRNGAVLSQWRITLQIDRTWLGLTLCRLTTLIVARDDIAQSRRHRQRVEPPKD
ncbi:MAG TPA: hypothetical protein VHV57_18070 [Acidimicrobiales bacterium]|jgi:hypothetical protein|nr:hypothetical protein [Acidimicrobiales bacterium]